MQRCSLFQSNQALHQLTVPAFASNKGLGRHRIGVERHCLTSAVGCWLYISQGLHHRRRTASLPARLQLVVACAHSDDANTAAATDVAADSQNPSAATTISTLALLELLLAQPPLQQATADSEALSPDLPLMRQQPSPDGDTQQSAEPSSSLQQTSGMHSAADIWAAAWQPFESPDPAPSHQSPRAAQPPSKPLPSLLFWRQQQQLQQSPGRDSGHTQQQQRLARQQTGVVPAILLRRAQVHLQGISPAARKQLLALCMASLEQLTAALSSKNARLSSKEWSQLCPALLAVCSTQAAVSWIGHCPSELQSQARQVVCQLAGDGSDPSAPSHLRMLGKQLMSRFTDATDQSGPVPMAAAQSDGQQRSLPADLSSSNLNGKNSSNNDSSSDTSSSKDASSDSSSSSNNITDAWQSARENVTLHSAALQILCQPKGDLGSSMAVQKNAAEPKLSAMSTDGTLMSEARRSHSSQHSSRQNLRSTAHQRLSDKRALRSSKDLQAAVRKQHRAVAMQQMLQSAPWIVQDMATHAAEAVAVAYLADARSGLNGAVEDRDESWPVHLHPQLQSTRSLERFRNQVFLNKVIHQNFQSVANIYEDRHHLYGFESQGDLIQHRIKARRVKELEVLKGWKYTYSVCLEAGDILLPIFRNCMARVSAAVSWLLTRLIGRALGLIFKGVKQSLAPQRQKQNKDGSAQIDREQFNSWMPRFS